MEVSFQSTSLAKMQDPPSTSESENQIDPITIDDIFKYYDFEPSSIKDPQVMQIIRDNKKDRMTRIVDRLNRCLPQIAQFLPNLTPLEYYIAFDFCCNDPESVILQSTDKHFLNRVRHEAADRKSLLNPTIRKERQKQLDEERERELNNEEEDDDEYESDEDERNDGEYTRKNVNDDDNDERKSLGFIKHKHHEHRDQSNKIDLPRPNGVDAKVWHKWSTIHQASYLAGIQNPNTYFYRNCAPGEKQKNGPWSDEEKRLFLNRLKEMRKQGVTKSKWGIFSQAIPGRVGYQCANFYRKLVIAKEIEDPSYYQDEDGVLRHKKVVSNSKSKYRKIYKKDKKDDEPTLSLYERQSKKNPFEHAIDSITKEEIKVPAMSPDGYVLDYSTWLNIIKEKAENPFTRAHIKTKRELVLLTKKNIDEYRDKIKNLSFD